MGANRVLSEHIPAFIAARSYSKNSVAHRHKVLGRFVAHTGDPPAGQLRHSHVMDWWASIATLAAASRQSHLSAVRTFCGHLIKTGVILSDPTAAITRPKAPPREPVTLAAREIVRLIASMPTARDRAIIALMLGCALRASDIAALNVEDISEDFESLVVIGKNQKQRRVPIPQAVKEAVAGYLEERRPPKTASGHAYGPLIRHIRDDGRMSPVTVQHAVTELLYEAGIKRGPLDGRSSHVLRRTCASVLLESGASIRDVACILGHESIATTQRYIRHPGQARLAELLEKHSPFGAA